MMQETNKYVLSSISTYVMFLNQRDDVLASLKWRKATPGEKVVVDKQPNMLHQKVSKTLYIHDKN